MEAVSLNTNISFKADDTTSKQVSQNIKSDLVKNPTEDKFEKNDKNTKTRKKKKNLIRNICLGTVAAIVLAYGGVVLQRKLSKPTFEEVQQCFKEIFQKDLSTEEVKALIAKYKEICKESKTDDFVKKMIAQLKTDYGVEAVKTELTVTKLKDSKLSTALNQTKKGSANPLAKIDIFPGTSYETTIRSILGDTFVTGFHEMKHIRQFADAYRTNPDEFAKAILLRPEENVKEIDKIVEDLKQQIEKLSKEDKKKFPYMSLEEIRTQILKNSGYKDEADIRTKVIENSVKDIRKSLDERFGALDPFKEGTEEYKKGMEYIRGYETYPDPDVDYEAYKANILEKEAWRVGDLARKIYKYTSSIWKL